MTQTTQTQGNKLVAKDCCRCQGEGEQYDYEGGFLVSMPCYHCYNESVCYCVTPDCQLCGDTGTVEQAVSNWEEPGVSYSRVECNHVDTPLYVRIEDDYYGEYEPDTAPARPVVSDTRLPAAIKNGGVEDGDGNESELPW